MKEQNTKREFYWSVEAVDRKGNIVYNGTFNNFETAYDKYYSFKNKATVTLRRLFKDLKLA
jgi:hypothetical protein